MEQKNYLHMKHFLLLTGILLFVANTLCSQNITMNDINSGKFYPKNVGAFTSSQDGLHFYKANDKKTQIDKYDFKTGNLVATVFDVNTARECNLDSFEGFVISPDEKRIIIFDETENIYRRSKKSVLYDFNVTRNYIKRLTNSSIKQSEPKFSRDGRMLVYVADNDLWLVKFDFDSESRLTRDGKLNQIINGATDWVYEEEFGTTSIIDFSADNNLIAFVQFNEKDVDNYSIPIYNKGLYPDSFTYKYPKTGTKNSEVTCKIFDIENKTLKEIKLPGHIEYIPRIEFFPEGDNLAIFTLNREQNQFGLYSANARSLLAKEILQEKNEYYVNSQLLDNAIFLDASIIYLSEKDGFQHIYLLDKNGIEIKQLTSGTYDVTQILGVNEKTGDVFYQAAAISPLEREIYKVNTKTGLTKKLSEKRGNNRATFSKQAQFFVNNYSNPTTPGTISLHEGNTGKVLSVMEDNKSLEQTLQGLKLPTKEFTTFLSADNNTELNGYIIKPYNFNPAKKYPVVMIQYSGPDSQLVLNRYELDWQMYLANQGYIVACVDGRGTGGRGEEFRKSTYMNLGIKESDDQIAVARQLGKLPFIDAKRIGIWGWSYGGYNTLMSMSRGKGVFKAGVAIAPVSDWRFYDTVYGERFMRTPQQNPEGYKNGSAINIINQLEGNLLMIHGSADDNVHLQNTMEYLDAAIGAGKNVDLFIMPDRDHSMTGAKNRNYIYNKVIKYFNDNL